MVLGITYLMWNLLVPNTMPTDNFDIMVDLEEYFMFISLHGHVDIVRFLLQNGANTELCDDWNCTPLHNAAGAGHYQIVDLLCEAGARLDARASNKGKTKTTRIF